MFKLVNVANGQEFDYPVVHCTTSPLQSRNNQRLFFLDPDLRYIDYERNTLDQYEICKLADFDYAVDFCIERAVAMSQNVWDDNEKNNIGRGNIVEVVRGKKNVGQIGKVVFIKDMEYGAFKRSYGAPTSGDVRPKLLIATSSRKTWVQKNGKAYENYADTVWEWKHNCDRMDLPEMPDSVKFSIRNEVVDSPFRSFEKYAIPAFL